jgi:hypothetical protein
MKKLLIPLLALAAAPAHAISIVSLHGGMVAPMASSTVDTVLIITGVAVLATVAAFRFRKRKLG